MYRHIVRGLVVTAVAAGLMVGCGGDGDEAETPAGGGDTPAAGSTAAAPSGGGDTPAPAGGGGGTLTLDGQAIAIGRTQCTFDPQEAAAGGGQILFVGQGYGETATGEEVLLDLSRFDEASMFTGDSVSLTVGDPFSEDAANYSLMGGEGSITVDGSTLSGQDVALTGDGGTTATVSFRLEC